MSSVQVRLHPYPALFQSIRPHHPPLLRQQTNRLRRQWNRLGLSDPFSNMRNRSLCAFFPVLLLYWLSP